MHKKIMIGLGVSLLVILVIAAGIVFYGKDKIIEPINNQLAALKAGDVDKAYSFTSRDFQNATSLADFQKFVDLYPAIKNNARTKFISKDVTGDNAKLTGTLISVDGISTPIEYLLIKEEGAWKILGIQVYPEGVTPEQTEVQPAVSSAAGPLQKKYDNSETDTASIILPAGNMRKQVREQLFLAGAEGHHVFLNSEYPDCADKENRWNFFNCATVYEGFKKAGYKPITWN